MKNYIAAILGTVSLLLILNCAPYIYNDEQTTSSNIAYKYLALGDSYTIGHSVCDTCGFPSQLKNRLNTELQRDGLLKVIAKTGWTTTNLLQAIDAQKLSPEYDLVTLLIGVNNQFQEKPFEVYKAEFNKLLNKAIYYAKGNPKRVIVVSIPDYGFTPYGEKRMIKAKISKEINIYNAYATSQAEDKGVVFINITDITRRGLQQKELVASDGLHPSKKAYALFVERLFDPAKECVLTN